MRRAVRRGGGAGAGNPTGTGWGPIDDDLVGTASARLLVSGVARRDRLEALSLLGLLVDHADADGRLRLPFETLAGEFGVAPARGRELLAALMAVEVVDSIGEMVVVASTSPAHVGGFRLTGFLANVATVLDDRSSERRTSPRGGGRTVLPDPGPAQRRRGRGESNRSRVLQRVLAGAGAAFVVMWATASPSGEPSSVRTVAGAPSSTGRAPWATTPSTVATDHALALVEDGPTPSPTGPAAPSVLPRSTQGGDATAGAGAEGAPDRSSDNAPPTSPGPDALASEVLSDPPLARPSPRPGPRLGPDPSSAPGPGSVSAGEDGQGGCPAGAPEAIVVDSRLVPAASRSLLDVMAEASVEVRGTVTNPSEADLVVRDLDVSAGEDDAGVTIADVATPLAVPSGGVAEWRVVLPPGAELPVPSVVEAHVLDWSWSDPVLESRCPS